MTFGPSNTSAQFLPTSVVFSEDDSQFLITLTNLYTSIAQSTNSREIALYDLVETVNGQQFFTLNNPQTKRQVFRKVFSFNAIASGAILNIPHGLTNVTAFTRIYGTCITSFPDYRPLPFVSTVASTNCTGLRVDATNVIVANGATATPIVSGFVVLEYLYR